MPVKTRQKIKFMKTSHIIIFIACLLGAPCKALGQDKFIMSGRVLNDLTRTDLIGSLVEVLDVKDSTLIDSTRAKGTYMEGYRKWYTSEFTISVPRSGKATRL